MTRTEKAIEIYKQRFNCSQAVFTAFRQADHLDERTALKLATVFGAGAACTGRELCGAVSGGLMALSMKYGRGDLEGIQDKANTYQLGRTFMADFAARHGSCTCERLLGVNIGTPEGMQQVQERRLFETECLKFVKSASELLEKLL